MPLSSQPFVAWESAPLAADADLAAEILQLRRLLPDLEPADSPVWLLPAYRDLAHRLVGARARVEIP